jgi:O-antigen ligase
MAKQNMKRAEPRQGGCCELPVDDPNLSRFQIELATRSRSATFFFTIATLVLTPLVFSALTPESGRIKALLIETIAVLACVAWCVRSGALRRLVWPWPAAARPLTLFIALNVVLALFSAYSRASATELWRLYVCCAMFGLGLEIGPGERRLRTVARTIAAVAGPVALYGILEQLGLDPFEWSATAVKGRSSSTLGHPNFLAGYLVMSLPVTAALFLKGKQKRRVSALLGIDVALQVMCLVFTFSRGGYIGAIAAALVLAVLVHLGVKPSGAGSIPRWPKWALAGIVPASVIAASLVGSSYNPFTSRAAGLALDTRKAIYSGSLSMFAAHPLFGSGPGTFSTVFPRYKPERYPEIDPRPNVAHAHSEYLNIVNELGLVGLGLFAWLLIAVARAAMGSLADTGEGEDSNRTLLRIGIGAGFIGMLAHATFSVMLRLPTPSSYFWLSLGLLAASSKETRMCRARLPATGVVPAMVTTALLLAPLYVTMSWRPFS